MSTFFEQINVLPKVRENLQKMGIKTPMPVQQQAIPALLKGRDVLAGPKREPVRRWPF